MRYVQLSTNLSSGLRKLSKNEFRFLMSFQNTTEAVFQTVMPTFHFCFALLQVMKIGFAYQQITQKWKLSVNAKVKTQSTRILASYLVEYGILNVPYYLVLKKQNVLKINWKIYFIILKLNIAIVAYSIRTEPH